MVRNSWITSRGNQHFQVCCTTLDISPVVYQPVLYKPDRVVNGNDVVVSKRVARRWRVDGQNCAERIGDNREHDN